MRTVTPRSTLPSAGALGLLLLATFALTPSASRPANAAPTADAASARCEAALEGLLQLMPTSIAGLSQTRAEIKSDSRMTGINAIYEGATEGLTRLEVVIGHGTAARGFVRDQLVARLRASGTSIETDVAAVPVTEGMLGDRVVVVGHPGSDRKLEALEGAFGRLHRIVDSYASPAPGSDDDGAPNGSIRCTADWDEMSFSYLLPKGWAVADLTAVSRGMLENVVLMLDQDVADEQFGSKMSFTTGDTLSLGSAGNVAVSLSAAPGNPIGSEATDFLNDMREAGLVEAMFPDGEMTGEVETRTVEGVSLVVMPFRGQDREGLEVRGWLSGIAVGETLVLGQLMVGPEASPAAVESAWRVLASVNPGSSSP